MTKIVSFRFMRIRFLVMAAVVAAALTGVVPGTGAQAVPNPVTLRVGTWNICGEYNGCPSVLQFQTKANMVANLVKSNLLHSIYLSEVCEWHVSEIIRQFRAIDPTWNAHFAPVRQHDPAHGWTTRRTRVCDRPEWQNMASA